MKITINLLLSIVLLLGVACQSGAEYTMRGKVSTTQNVMNYKLTLRGVDTTINIVPDAENNFQVNLPEGVPFFNLECSVTTQNRKMWQFTSPICFEAGKALKINIELGDTKEKIEMNDKTNKIIQELRACYNQKMRELWNETPNLANLENWINAHIKNIKDIIAKEEYSAQSAEFIDTWKQVELLKFFKGVRYFFPDDDTYTMPDHLLKLIPDAAQTFDRTYWKLFEYSDMEIMSYLQTHEKEPEGQMKMLNERFQTQTIREEISNRIVANFLKRYPYSLENVDRIEKLCVNHKDKENIVKQFKGKEFSTRGAAALDVSFEDINGKLHKISEFKGKYVYIDLWASWCSPCCAEVPALQKLEKELNNPHVVFLSISLDKNKEQWRKKMEQLNMSGNQWIVTGDEFSDKMNIKSIPHFLLYDKEGKLIEYRAPQPSKSILRHQLSRLR